VTVRSATAGEAPPSVAYIVGYYPAVSHVFITREVDGLRERGISVHTISLRRAPEKDLLTEADRRAAGETHVIQPPALATVVRAHAQAVGGHPLRYVRTLVRALGMGSGGMRGTLYQLFYFAEAILVWHELRRRGVRHVHAHFANAACTVAMLAADFGRAEGLSWSFTMHGPTEFDDVTAFALADKVRDAQWVACISDYCRSQLMKLVEPRHWDRLEIVHCGVDAERFAPVDRSARDPGALEVLCLGRLVPDKGQVILLDAVAALRRDGSDARLTLAGDGPDRGALEAHAKALGVADAVRFVGAVGQDRIRELYAAADVFCLPSFAEGVPVVLMEAMACGLPVVTTRITGVPELVDDGRSGMLVRPGRSDELAGALQRMLDDPEMRRRLGETGRRKVEAEYDIAGSVDDLYRLFANGSRP
jgi:colanic acid/amylovoran biosynthesis glycosyltransferase